MKFFDNLFSNDNHLPTISELEKRYKTKFIDNKFPFGASDNCCVHDEYVSDFISHRMRYHKISLKQTLKELDEFMKELNEINKKEKEQLK